MYKKEIKSCGTVRPLQEGHSRLFCSYFPSRYPEILLPTHTNFWNTEYFLLKTVHPFYCWLFVSPGEFLVKLGKDTMESSDSPRNGVERLLRLACMLIACSSFCNSSGNPLVTLFCNSFRNSFGNSFLVRFAGSFFVLKHLYNFI